MLPSISFVEGQGPHVMTCREHNDGSKELYIHPPRQPHHTIPSQKGDQLCHAVIKPRLIKPMKASKYSNTYQMHEQRGSFQGIDTCNVTNFGDFSFLFPGWVEVRETFPRSVSQNDSFLLFVPLARVQSRCLLCYLHACPIIKLQN